MAPPHSGRRLSIGPSKMLANQPATKARSVPAVPRVNQNPSQHKLKIEGNICRDEYPTVQDKIKRQQGARFCTTQMEATPNCESEHESGQNDCHDYSCAGREQSGWMDSGQEQRSPYDCLLSASGVDIEKRRCARDWAKWGTFVTRFHDWLRSRWPTLPESLPNLVVRQSPRRG